MKRTIALLALTLTATTFAFADRFAAVKGSSVTVTGTSTLHEWTMRGNTIDGEIVAPAITQWGSSPAKVIVTIPVKSLKSEHDKMDQLMANALKADKNPTIRYELTQAVPAGDMSSFTVKSKGKLTIAGVTKEVDITVTGARNSNGQYALTGEAPLKMTDFGIKPPTAMLGTIKTGDNVKVKFLWAVDKK
jgi:polyisoprenoid-binding protein YceI